MWGLILWGFVTISTSLLFILLTVDVYKRLIAYYKILGIKYPKKKYSIGSKFTSLIKSIMVVTFPILHFLYLTAFLLCYEQICQKVVDSYIADHKTDEIEMLKEKENER